ncbi:alpha/beta fold hydrolase [Antrihabitans cavernicola]|uniref:Alpha/beta hydrolase n=1 Tax=Antrihabitans cavernicola TaxID=2495913 RepID=A0A5A7SB05_9NOCA|nr:alpha/beta hydrolase [Spelaeibacter cavernicola]KAA0022704.1 alpha/beta hydrolase [Spelaeibacter cavernicola]
MTTGRRRPVEPTVGLHMGSGEPVLLIQPFLLSPHVWERTAEKLAESFEVFAPALAGHWGGAPIDGWNVTASTLADDIERQLDELGWNTCHIVGNSLGGWVGFELERRGRARTLTAVAPAGGWRELTVAHLSVGLKFLSFGPLIGLGRVLGDVAVRNRAMHRLLLPLVAKNPSAISRHDAEATLTAAINCPAYLPTLWSGLRGGGVTGLGDVTVPVRLLLCDHDWIIPMRRYGSIFLDELPADADRITVHGVGHVPMLEDPDRIAMLIAEHVRAHRTQLRAV